MNIVTFNEEKVKEFVKNLAKSIIDNHPNLEKAVFIGILTSGYPLAQRLARIIKKEKKINIPVGKLDISLYRDDLLEKERFITIKESEIPFNIDNQEVIIVDDVLFSGRTARAAMEGLLDYGRPKRIDLAVLIDRGYRELPIKANYLGFELKTAPDEHIEVKLYEIDGEDKVIIKKDLK